MPFSTRCPRRRARSVPSTRWRSAPVDAPPDTTPTGSDSVEPSRRGWAPTRRGQGCHARGRRRCGPRRCLRPFDLGLRTLRVNDKDAEQARALVQTLAGAVGRSCSRWIRRGLSAVGGVVNATPVGMLGIPGDPIPLDAIGSHSLGGRRDLHPARDQADQDRPQVPRGARVMGGAGMCVHQAAETFRLFTGLHRRPRSYERHLSPPGTPGGCPRRGRLSYFRRRQWPLG